MNEDAGNGGHAPGRGQAGRRRARRPAAEGRAARAAGLRLEGQRGLARRGLQGHRADRARRAAGQGRAAQHRQRARPARAGRRSGASLLAVPDDLGHRGGAPQRGAGHRRRRQLRAAGPVQGGRAGRQARRRDVDLGRRLPGQRARAPAAALHRARPAAGPTSTSTTPTSSATSCSALLSRAFRAYEPTGTEGRGRPDARAGDAARRGAVLPDDPVQGRRATRWFAIDVPAGRRRVRLGDRDPAAGLGRARAVPVQALTRPASDAG